MINFGNKHVKDILYARCSNHLISVYNIYSLQRFECQHRYKNHWHIVSGGGKGGFRGAYAPPSTPKKSSYQGTIFFMPPINN